MAASSSLSSRRGLGGFAALAGAALMVVSVFLPWLTLLGEESITGWDTYTDATGMEQFYMGEAFDTGFSPWFSGMSVLIAGAVMALLGLALLASVRGGAFALPAAGKLVVGVLAALAAIVGVTNLASLYATGPGAGMLDPEYGLFLLTAGALIGFLGVVAGFGKGRS
jgi:hypothetical protein